MNKSARDYRLEAMNLLRGNYQKPIIIYLIFIVANGIITGSGVGIGPTGTSLSSIISILLGAAIEYEVYKLAIRIIKKENYEIEEILVSGFKENYLTTILLYFVRSIFIFLWALLLIIPGIIKSYAYSMSMYLRNKLPDVEFMELINKSKELTNGHKADIFFLDLSYIGWYILSAFTFGILLLWVVPRHMTARTLLFNDIYAPFEVKEEPEEPKAELE